MDIRSLHQQVSTMRQSFFDEEILDKHFVQLEQLEGNDSPNFVEEVINLYFRDTTKLIATTAQALENVPLDFVKLDKMLHQLKGSSASIGANKVKIAVNQTRESCKEADVEGCKAAFETLRTEHQALKAKFESYFQLQRQAGPADTAVRPK